MAKIETPQELFKYKLGAVLTMEQTVLEMLEKNVEEAQDEQVKALFRHHQDETRQHIDRLHQVFGAFGWEVDDSPCPAIQGIDKEGKANAKKADDSIVDSIILSGAMETEHHEIAVYENLIINAQALGKQDAVRLLEQNLEQEQHTLDEVKEAARRIAMRSPQPAA